MEYGFSILMFALAAGLLIYAGLLAATKDVKMIVRHYYARIKNEKEYAAQFAKVIAVVAIAPALSGITGLIWTAEETLLPAVLVLFVGLIVCIYIGTRIMKKVIE